MSTEERPVRRPSASETGGSMRRRRTLLVAFAVVAALAVAGAVSASPGARQAASAKQKATFQLSFFPNAQHVGYLVAAHRGYYGRAGLNISVKPGGPTVEPTLLVAQGQVDIAQVDFTEFVQAVSKGAPITYVALTYQQDPVQYVSLKSTPLSSPADLKGKTIGQQQAGDLEPELLEMLDKAGLTVNDVKPVAIGFTIDDLLSGKCQVFPSRTYFHPAEFEDKGIDFPGGLNVLDPNKLGLAIANQGVAVNNSFLKKHPSAVVAFLRASLKGWYQAIGNPRAAVADVEAYIPKGASNPQDDFVDTKTTTAMVTHRADGTPYKKILAIDMNYLNRSQDILLKYKVISKKIDLTKYVNTSLLEQARAKPLK
jgi:NitT/TauT family transport system substrate-binding protein